MATHASLSRGSGLRLTWSTALFALVALTGALLIVGFAVQRAPAQAAVVSIDQCNNIGPGPGGATTSMTCTVTIVNTISGGITSSTVTVTRLCGNDPCPPGNGTVTTSYPDLVTSVSQCNGSDNDAAHPITCTVDITNNISADTPGAQPVTAATVNQCVGTGGGGGQFGAIPAISCTPFPANTSGATVTQCNGSVTGGGSSAVCSVGTGSAVSPAIPITVNQCNGTGNAGGTLLTCDTNITTNITPAVVPTPTPTPTSTGTPTPTPTATSTGTPTPTPTATSSGSGSGSPAPTPTGTSGGSGTGTGTGTGTGAGTGTDTGTGTGTGAGTGIGTGTGAGAGGPQVPQVPVGGVSAGGGSTAGSGNVGLLMLGNLLLLAAVIMALLRQRVAMRSGR